MINLMHGDCLEKLKEIENESIDSIVTDPPYGLAFMGKKWDYDVPSVEIWKECLRVLKPGGHLLSFGGTRTYHRMVVAIEDAGFEIRDQIQWIYGSGFPKSMDISKAIDKQAGAVREREKCGTLGSSSSFADDKWTQENAGMRIVDSPITDSAKQWEGWGTALKPANEPICLARKPISEMTVASNVLKHGTGAMNIDESRISVSENDPNLRSATGENGNSESMFGVGNSKRPATLTQGRWPANVILDEEAGELLDEQSGNLSPGGQSKKPRKKESGSLFNLNQNQGEMKPYAGEVGGASRFFYCAKASKSERNAGLEELEDKILARSNGAKSGINNDNPSYNENAKSGYDKIIQTKNHHPTVKPIKLMAYLIKLITPPNGIVLDPFMGSGSTGVAARAEGSQFVGIEREKEYFEIAKSRIENA